MDREDRGRSSRPVPRPTVLGSMRVRIVGLIVLLLLVSSLGSLLILRAALFSSLERDIEASLAREIAEFERLEGGNDPRTGEPFAGDLEALFDVYFSREIPDEGETLMAFVDGELYASRRARGAAAPSSLGGPIATWLGNSSRTEGSIDTQAGQTRYVVLPVDGADGQVGHLVAANFPALERDEINEAVSTQSLIQVGMSVAVALLALTLVGRVLRPLRDLAVTARVISETDLDERVPVTGRDEASQIASTFNGMLARLQGAFAGQRRFLDDTSHELRAPLTVIRGHLELLELDATADERRETLALVEEEMQRATGLIDDLLLLARAEQPDFLVRRPTDSQDLVRDIYDRAVVMEADRDWALVISTPGVIQVDANRLTQAGLQLAHNAVKHTGAGDRIEVGARMADGLVTLWVDDAGSGVPDQDREIIFERFGRARGRQSDTGPAGTGLGLAIVASIAEQHGGTARLVARPGPGARFEVAVPTAPPVVRRSPDPL